MLEQKYLNRLAYLADSLMFFEGNPYVKKFDMGIFFVKHDCGTVACACGFAAQLPSFNVEGLCIGSLYNYPGGDTAIQYKDKYNWAAIKEFFGLTMDEAQWLFSETSYSNRNSSTRTTPEDVAKRIKEFLLTRICF
jgi:hypothetical protein